MLVAAVFSRHVEALSLARTQLELVYGPVERSSPIFLFDQTAYYADEMGGGLRKQFFAFHDLITPERLSEIKLHTNALEREIAQSGATPKRGPSISTLDIFNWVNSSWRPPRTRAIASTSATAFTRR